MDYLREFETVQEFEAEKDNLLLPNVSFITDGSGVKYIEPMSINEAVVTCNSATYDGTNKVATNIVVILRGTTLVEGTDYAISSNAGGINAGVYPVIVNGINQYKGNATGTFTINKVTPTVTAPVANSLTYDGSAQQLATAGSTDFGSLEYSLDAITYNTSVPNGTAAGSYVLYYKVDGDDNINSVAPATISCSIAKAAGSVTTAPVAEALTYNTSAQALVSAGSGTGTMMYKLDSSEWGTSIPSATTAGTYTVYYKAAESANYEESASGSVSCSIAKVTPTLSVPTAKTELIYTGSEQQLANAGSTDYGTIQYKLSDGTYGTSVPSGTNAANYTVYYKVVGDSNINDVAEDSIVCQIAKADTVYTAPTAKTGLIYNASAQELITVGAVVGGTMEYSDDNATWSETIPTGTDANTYTSYWRIVGDANHNDKTSESLSTAIAVKTVSSPTITLSPTNYTYNGLACEPAVTVQDGSITIPNTEYTVSYSDNINVGTATCTITDKTGGNYIVNGSTTFTISKVTPTVTAPTPQVLTFNTENQVLANAGSTDYGTIQYCLNDSGGTYSTTVPSASAANVTYDVWYKVIGDSNINDVAPASINCMIAEKRVTTPTIELDPSSYTYDGSACQPTVTVKDGSTVIPAAEYTKTFSNNTNAGTATVTITDNTAGNYYISGTTTFTINKAAGSVTSAPTANSLTYNNTAHTLIIAGSGTGTMMYKLDNGEWGTSIPTATNAGDYTVYYKASASTNYEESASGSVAVNIAKVTPTVTAPTAKSLTYNGSAQALVNAGSTNYGTLKYSRDNSSWSTSIPTATSAGEKTVYYRVDGDSNVNDVAAKTLGVTIAKADQSAPTATGATTTYNTTATATASGGGGQGSIEWSNGNTQTSVGSKTTKARWSGNSNYNASPWSSSVTVQMNKAAGSVTINGVSLTYNGSARNLATVSNNTGTMHYSTNGTSWSTSIPTATDANSYKVYWYMDASTNYNGIASASSRYVSSTIGKADQSAPTATGATTTYSTTATATASGGGGKGSIEWSNGNTQTSVGSKTTKARWSGNSNYNASPYSNEVTLTMNKAAGSVSTAPVNTNYTYNGTARAVASAGSGTGTMYYRLGTSGSFSTTMPTMTNAGSNTLYYYAAASTNYNQSSTGSITVSVQKANQSAPTAYDSVVSNGSTATLTASGGGGQGSLQWSNGNTRTAVGCQTSEARWAGNNNYYASDWSDSAVMIVKGSHNGHEYVDLGLPSGTKWATMNVGASSESNIGNYYRFGKGLSQMPGISGETDYATNDSPLPSSLDTASLAWGGSWHMATEAQCKELQQYCRGSFVTINGVKCVKLVSRVEEAPTWRENGGYIIIPSGGLYVNRWGTCMLDTNRTGFLGSEITDYSSSPRRVSGIDIFTYSEDVNIGNSQNMSDGCPVRPVVG